MKTFVMIAAALMLFSNVALGAAAPTPLKGGPPPTAAQMAEFSKLCLKRSAGNTTLCTCKTAQAPKLIDGAFMTLVLASMNDKTLPVEDSKNYAIYISASNKVCAPGM
jgi:hypothetical protein